MNVREKEFDVDLYDVYTSPITLKQNDTTRLIIKVKANGNDFDLTDKLVKYVFIRKDNSTIRDIATSIQKNVVTLDLAAKCLELFGEGKLEVQIYENAELISSFEIDIDIAVSYAHSTELIEGGTYLKDIDTAMEALEQKADDFDEAEKTRTKNENIRIENEKARVKAETARATAEGTRSENETDRTAAENQRALNETARQESYNSQLGEFNQNAINKTNDFNENASAKTIDFNTNATNQGKVFDDNAATKTTDFNTNATNKTTEAINAVNTAKDNALEEIEDSKEELKNENENLRTELEDEEAEGSEISFDGSAQARMEIEIRGAIEQTTYEGYNLLNLEYANNTSVERSGLTATYDGEYFKIAGTTTSVTYIEIFPNFKGGTTPNDNDVLEWKDMYLFLEGEIENNASQDLILIDDTTNVLQRVNFSTYLNMPLKINNNITRIFYNTGTLNAKINDKFRVAVLKKKTGYEPYVGAQASPNLEYPQSVKCVTGENKIIIETKNKFKATDLVGYRLSVNTGVVYKEGSEYTVSDFIDVKPSTNYTLSGLINGGAHFVWYDKNKNYISGGQQYMNQLTYQESPIDAYYFRFDFKIIDKDIVQFEEGTVATPYSEHKKEQVYPLSLGDKEIYEDGYIYEDENGDFYVYNEWEKYIFTGEENWKKSSKTAVNRYGVSSLINILYLFNDVVVKSNCFTGIAQSSSDNNRVGISGSSNTGLMVNFDINDINFDTLEKFTNYLKQQYENGTPVYAVYRLEEPSKIKITDTTLINQLKAIKKAQSFYGQTNITATCEEGNLPMKLKVTYKKSSRMRIEELENKNDDLEARVEALEQAILSQGANV